MLLMIRQLTFYTSYYKMKRSFDHTYARLIKEECSLEKHISIFIATILMLGIMAGFGMPAKADGDVTLTVTPEVTELTEPGTVNFTAAVTNSTTETLTSYAVMQGGNVKYDSGGATLVRAIQTAASPSRWTSQRVCWIRPSLSP